MAVQEKFYMKGKNIYLRGLRREDLRGNMFNWANDEEITYYMYMGLKPNCIDVMEKEYDALVNSNKDIAFAVIDKDKSSHIGNVGLYEINWLYRSAEYRIVIGEKNYWNKGYGTQAANLVIGYGFDKLNLNKIWLGVNAENKNAIKSYKNTGFIEEGLLRDEIYRNGRYYDAVRMSILRNEFYEKKS
jgi:[ribosomal protein S5]-alanine N-acetyltransferase